MKLEGYEQGMDMPAEEDGNENETAKEDGEIAEEIKPEKIKSSNRQETV